MEKELRNKISENKILTYNERAKIISDLESYEDLRTKIDKAIEEIKDLYTEWENSTDDARLESNPYGAVLNVLQRNIGE